MYRIRWRNRETLGVATEGMSRYTQEAAERQVRIWQGLFPFNDYYILPA